MKWQARAAERGGKSRFEGRVIGTGTVAKLDCRVFGSEKAKRNPRANVAPVYRDPENSENTWTGRRQKPKWLIAPLESDKSVADLKII